MRPRVFPAEDARNASAALHEHGRFNEAAGIPRGRHTEQVNVRIADGTLQ